MIVTMDTNIAISIKGASKCFRVYDRPEDRLKQGLFRGKRKYYREFWAVNDVSFDINRGETVAIIGRNGSGKSTLLQMIAGTLTPTSGGVKVNGRIAALLELGSGFNPEFTGRENVYMNGAILGLSREEMDRRFEDIAKFADIGDFIEQPVKTYSSGMVVRLAFAVTVNIDPDILIVDEALSVGDVAFQQKCLLHLEGMLSKGVTILLVSHDAQLVRNYCSKAIYLQHGKVKLISDAETVTESYLMDLRAEQLNNTADPDTQIGWKKKPGADGGFSFGSNAGDIISVYLKDKFDRMTNHFLEGEQLIINIQARVSDKINNPRLLFAIRDQRGYTVYGYDTASAGVFWSRVDAGEQQITASFSIEARLAPGQYSISVSLQDYKTEHLNTLIDRHVNVVQFTMLKKGPDYTGIVNLNAQVRRL